MKLQDFSYRTQIFFSSLLLVILPTIILGIATANRTSNEVQEDFSRSMDTITTQANLTLDTLLQDATKVADLHILNKDIRKIMITNYEGDLLGYSQDSYLLSSQLIQANRLNSNVTTCMFKNRYDYTFEYNIPSVKDQNTILDHMDEWAGTARNSDYYTYFAPVQQSSSVKKSILPMVKVLYDSYTFKEIGICYVGINFSAVENIANSAQTQNNVMLIYNADGGLAYSSDKDFIGKDASPDLKKAIQDFNQKITKESSVRTEKLNIGSDSYLINGCYNKTTGWHIVHFMNNSLITQAYRNNLYHYAGIFLLAIFLGLILAALLSRGLTRSIRQLCEKIDSRDTSNYSDIAVEGRISNQELQKVVHSFNRLNSRLTQSIQQNYQSRLNEQQMHIQVLQAQINHHFLYNTLNVIKSLADIHNVPEIKTIATCMSELLRYNLKKVPIVYLKEELLQIQRYMTIQNIRFPGKFSFDYDVPDEFLGLEIPAFILQPFVENAIGHGFSEKEENCYISISANLEGNTLHFLIADNGQGMKKEELEELIDSLDKEIDFPADTSSHHSIGIGNVQQRIQSYYGKEYGLTIESFPGQGTLIDIALPYGKKPVLPYTEQKNAKQ